MNSIRAEAMSSMFSLKPGVWHTSVEGNYVTVYDTRSQTQQGCCENQKLPVNEALIPPLILCLLWVSILTSLGLVFLICELQSRKPDLSS